jgi:hypothetical protein
MQVYILYSWDGMLANHVAKRLPGKAAVADAGAALASPY